MPSASMAPTPDRGPRLGLLLGVCLVLAGAGAMVFALLDSSESAPPPPAKGIASALEQARPASEEFAGFTETELALGDDCLRIVIADSPDERGQGMRGHETLGPYDGMLFVNDTDTTAGYTMSGVTVPLDIGWYASDGDPVDRTELEPCPEARPDCPLYSADDRYRFAVETLRGELPSGALGSCSA
jgi:uncharacterized membrane protein (UPF0127 family)